MKLKLFLCSAFTAMLCVFPLHVHATDDFSYTLKDDGTAEVTCINKNITKAEIPSEIGSHIITGLSEKCFADCIYLTEVNIPETVISFGDYAFYGCSSLTEIYIPESVTKIGNYVFETTERMTAIHVDENNPAYQSPDGVLFDQSGETLIKYPEARPDVSYQIPDTCHNIADWALIGARYLESIDLNQVKQIGEDAFYYCTALKSISIPEGVTELPGAVFGYCTALEQVYFPSTLISLGDECFYNCTSLKAVRLPENFKALGAYTFCQCESLEMIVIPKNMETVNAYCMGYLYDSDSDSYQVQENCTLYVWRDSPAWKYAVTNHLHYELLKDPNQIYYILIGIVSIIIIILIIAILRISRQRRENS